MKWNLTFYLAIAIGLLSFNTDLKAQSIGELSGTVTDINTGEAIEVANVVLTSNSGSQEATITDETGFYTIKPIPVGTYKLSISSIGYHLITKENIIISEGKIAFQDVQLTSKFYKMPVIEIVEERIEPWVMEPDNPSTITRITRKVMKDLPTKNIADAIKLTPGVYQPDAGGTFQIRGARQGASMIMLDGMRVENLDGIPYLAIEQMQVITGGLPAKYGDTTAGAIIVSTRSYLTD